MWSSRVLGICGSSSKPLFLKHLTSIHSFQDFQYVCCVPQVFLTNAPQVTATPLGRRQGKNNLLTWLLQEGPRQVEPNNHNSLRTRSAPFPHYCLQEIEMGPGEAKGHQDFLLRISQYPFSWLSIHLVAVNPWLASRVPVKLILTAFAHLFTVFVEGWSLGVPTPTISQAS